MKRTIFALLFAVLALSLIPALSQPANAADTAEIIEVKKIDVTAKRPALGMAIADLSATVDGAVLEGIHVYNAYTEEEITEGILGDNIVYIVRYVFDAAEGTKFSSKLKLYFGDAVTTIYSESETRAYYQLRVTSCKYLSNVALTAPDIYPGMKKEEIRISLSQDSNYSITDYQIIDLADNSADWESLQAGHTYRISATIKPHEGYYFGSVFYAYCNFSKMNATVMNEGTYGIATLDFSVDLGDVTISGLPSSIIEGSIPTNIYLRVNNDRVSIQSRWTDANKETVTAFKEGNTYYLTISLQLFGVVGNWDNPVVNTGSYASFLEKVDDKNVIVYIPYTPIPDIGTIRVTTSGIGKGLPISGVAATVDGPATISNTYIGENGSHTMDDDIFENGKVYIIRFSIKPAEGYRIGNKTSIVVNGAEHEFTENTNSISFTLYLNTNKEITSAKISVSGVGIGKSISKVKVSASSSSYYLDDEDWYSTNTSSSTFKKGERYYLNFCLRAEDGYCFAEDIKITAGGKKVYNITLYGHNDEVWGMIEWEYMTDISKVSLPAMPKSVSLGSTLPTNFKVSSSAKYTLQPVWVSLSTQEQATTASQKDSYVLTYVVTPKKGYEFTEDTVFYVNGKKVTPMLASYNGAEIMKVYNVGLTEIDRIDLTVAEPEKDAIPGTVTVPADAPYAPATVGWGVNTSGKLDDSVQDAAIFENYKYHFLGVEFVAADGYAFADKVTVYINGNKFAVLEDYAFGPAYQMTVSFGKLGEIAKLTAPELVKDGFTLSWGGVRNADAYEIYRATSKSGKYTKVGTVAETTWIDSPEKGKTYYYKVKAIFTPDTTKNSSYSAVVSIVYKCDTPVISVENAASGKPVVSWEKVSGAKKYTVYRATSESGKYTKLGTTTKLSYTDSKAKSGNTYFYKVIANGSKSSYNSGYSNIVSCGVICGAPSVTVKIDTNTGKPSLSWKKVDAATGYAIYRDGELLTTVTAVTYADTTAAIDTQYSYAVQALGKTEDLNGSLSKAVSATSGIAKPAAKGSVDTVSGKPVITWQAVEGAVKYEVYRSTKSSKSYKLVATVEELTYTDETVSAGKTYYYKVKAIGEVSKSADSSYVKLTGKCATPEISVTNDAKGKPYITWEKVSGAKTYTVYRATSETGKYTKLGTTTKVYYTDSKASAGTTYFYKIIANASSSKNNSPYSNIVSCGVNCATPVVKVTTNESGQPVLSWSKVSGAVKYEIYLLGAEDYVTLATVTGTSWTDAECAVGEGRYYGVRAIAAEEAYNSEVSEPVFGRGTCATPKPSGKVGDNKKPVVSWGEVEGAVKYVVYRSTSKSKGYKVIGEAEALTYEDLTAKKGKTYYYKVVAVGENCESAQSGYVKVKSK